jgi:hypothetical protein
VTLSRIFRIAAVLLIGGLVTLLLVGLCGLVVYHGLPALPGHLGKPTLSPTATPEQVAQRYYEAQSAGDAAAVADVVWAGDDPGWQSLDDSLRGATGIDTTASWAGGSQYGTAFSEVRETSVRYVRVRPTDFDEPPGRDSRFVILGRLKDSGRWVFVSSGEGP